MRLLVLGGTRFFGRHLVEAALARGHEVTLFNRGRHGAGLLPEAERLEGDRDARRDEPPEMEAGIPREREGELLRAWHETGNRG